MAQRAGPPRHKPTVDWVCMQIDQLKPIVEAALPTRRQPPGPVRRRTDLDIGRPALRDRLRRSPAPFKLKLAEPQPCPAWLTRTKDSSGFVDEATPAGPVRGRPIASDAVEAAAGAASAKSESTTAADQAAATARAESAADLPVSQEHSA